MKIAFIGHRKISKSQDLKRLLTEIISGLIENEGAEVFLFGSRSEFDCLCYDIASDLKNKYEHIRRIYVRAEYEYIDKSYIEYLMSIYDDTVFPDKVKNAHALSYIKRNQVMIDECDVLIAYFDENYVPKARTGSGTRAAVGYALKKKKRVINIFDLLSR